MQIDQSSSVALMAMSINNQTLGSQVVTKTLDYMHEDAYNPSAKTDADYDFQIKVLGAAFEDKANNINKLV